MKKLVCGLLSFLAVQAVMHGAAPTITCPDPVTVPCGEEANLELKVFVQDTDTNALEVTWTIDGTDVQTDSVSDVDAAAGIELAFHGSFGGGAHEVVVKVSDGGDPVSCTTTVTVEDTTPPVIEKMDCSTKILWPPNHKMWPVHVKMNATDDCGEVTCKIVSITSDEPQRGVCEGDTPVDWVIKPDSLCAYLRAERAGRGDGRTYTITVECADAAGNTATETLTVKVPHSMGKPKVPDQKQKGKGKNQKGKDKGKDKGKAKGGKGRG